MTRARLLKLKAEEERADEKLFSKVEGRAKRPTKKLAPKKVELRHAYLPGFKNDRWLPKLGTKFQVVKLKPLKKFSDGSYEPATFICRVVGDME